MKVAWAGDAIAAKDEAAGQRRTFLSENYFHLEIQCMVCQSSQYAPQDDLQADSVRQVYAVASPPHMQNGLSPSTSMMHSM